MKKICRKVFVGALLAALLAVAYSPLTASAKSEDEYIADLASPKEGVVTGALLKLEKEYPTSTKALPTIKKLLTDSRDTVRRKAARVLGALHADVSAEDIKNICALLKGAESREQMDGLIALRGLKAADAVPEILPLLKSTTPNVIRDACRTLAVLGGKDVIPAIEPLATHPEPKVQKDAKDAIFLLKSKP
jgi:HEAT repeat protein